MQLLPGGKHGSGKRLVRLSPNAENTRAHGFEKKKNNQPSFTEFSDWMSQLGNA